MRGYAVGKLERQVEKNAHTPEDVFKSLLRTPHVGKQLFCRAGDLGFHFQCRVNTQDLEIPKK